jgi:Outer membrane protein beta-barrel domain
MGQQALVEDAPPTANAAFHNKTNRLEVAQALFSPGVPPMDGDGMSMRIRALTLRIAIVALFVVAVAPDARADSFISPLIGFNFGGDSGCPTITGCEDKRMNYGVALGSMGAVLGFETEFAYANDFFGTGPDLSSSVFTVMGNVMLVPALGPVRPYALAGLGIIKSHVEFSETSLLTTDNTDFGWDIGGGIFILFGEHVGVRGDIRHFHSFEDLSIAGIELGDTNLDFGRASAALVLKF